MSPLDPTEVQEAITQAERRAGKRQSRLLIAGLMSTLIILGLAIVAIFLAYQATLRNREVITRVLTISRQNQDIAAIVSKGTNRILDCTTPEGLCARQGRTQTASAIEALNRAGAVRIQDLLRKIGEMERSLGVPQSTIDRILREPTVSGGSIVPPARP